MATDANNPARPLDVLDCRGRRRGPVRNRSLGCAQLRPRPNFEAAADAGGNNVYDVVVQVSDGSVVDTQALAVTVSNANEAATGALNIATYTPRPTETVMPSASRRPIRWLIPICLPGSHLPVATVRQQWPTWTNIAGATGQRLQPEQHHGPRRINLQRTVWRPTVISPETAIIGNGDDNTLAGTAGNDFQLGLGGNDTLLASAGNDVIDGGSGTDTYSLSATSAAANVNLTAGTATSATTGNDSGKHRKHERQQRCQRDH